MEGNRRVAGVDRRRFLGLGLAGSALAVIGCDGNDAPKEVTTPPVKGGGGRARLQMLKDKTESKTEPKTEPKTETKK